MMQVWLHRFRLFPSSSRTAQLDPFQTGNTGYPNFSQIVLRVAKFRRLWIDWAEIICFPLLRFIRLPIDRVINILLCWGKAHQDELANWAPWVKKHWRIGNISDLQG